MSAPSGFGAHEAVRLSVSDGLAVIEIDNPPVNALYDAIRDAIAAMLPVLAHDPAVAAILVVGAGRAFSAGVDLKKTAARAEPFFFHAALDAMDRAGKPLLAAIQGPALGGGLELALACHYRLAGPRARFGLPEVEVGIIPGACGTQRLPRLVPLDCALGVAALGDLLDSGQAHALGLVDDLAQDDDFRAEAIAWARARRYAPLRRTRDLPVIAPRNGSGPEAAFAVAALRAARERPGESAPLKAIEAVRAACERSFDEGVEIERRLVTECKYSAEAKAKRHLFFAERAAGKVDSAPRALQAIHIDGSRASRLAAVQAAAIASGAGGELALHAVGSGEAPAVDAITVLLPDDSSGLVELALTADVDDALLAAAVRLLRPFGRALVIGRGALLGERLRSVLADAGGQFTPASIARLADEGERMLRANTAARAGDIDIACVMALGFPRSRGGPMYLRKTSARLNRLMTRFSRQWARESRRPCASRFAQDRLIVAARRRRPVRILAWRLAEAGQAADGTARFFGQAFPLAAR
ncbi:enoyl-CoA hydratase/isomerase family protein [Massilia cavernae]|uniref:Enoyl-CoA hydratase/isomerase family protein n=1 Tax=Massilia cavernae TaxID=2320864 RepID=A0A418X739_9BURK|nr:enoyl-CoA hydratase/isomerase family protein [Massilia cavernae]RJG08282.1 enoyl-CoA hydratase/isomerase family protein [Massilia cavernae]